MAKFTYTSKTQIYVDDLEADHGTVHVYGLDGPVKSASLGITRFDHGYANDVDLLLVAPDGVHNLVVMSDTGGPQGYGGFNFSFSDDGATQMGTPIMSGTTYKPTDNVPTETAANWGLSIPTINHPAAASFASSFGGINGNGDWSLYMKDDAPDDFGSVRWNLTVETDESFAALVGTAGNDVIRLINSSSGVGVFEINERGGVAFEGVLDTSVHGGAGNDLIIAGTAVDRISAGSGRDTVYAGASVDYIYVGPGDDAAGEIYDGGTSDDSLLYTGNAALDLRDDTLNSIERIRLEGGGKVMLNASQISGPTSVWGFNDLTHPDELAVTMGASTGVNLGQLNFAFFDQAGDVVTVTGDVDGETVLGSKVDDLILTKGGSDYIIASLGRDTIDGGKGSDGVDYSSSNVAVRVALNGSNDVGVTVGGVVEDTIRNVEVVWGGSAADVLTGDKKQNGLKGGGGADKLKGGAGDDVLEGGLGADTVAGGAGRDQFYFTTVIDAVDRIKDFSHKDDTIVLDNSVFTAFAKHGGISSKAFKAKADGHEATNAK